MPSPGRSISRDEARDLAVVALLLAWLSYLLAGLVQALAADVGSWRLQLNQLLKYWDGVSGGLVLGAAMLVVFAPPAALDRGIIRLARLAATTTLVGGLLQAFNLLTLTAGIASFFSRLWPVLDNGVPAAILGGAATVILRHHDPLR